MRRVEKALTVPRSALKAQGEEQVVFVWDGTEAQPRTVKTGATSQGRVEVLEGLKEGERVLEKAPKE